MWTLNPFSISHIGPPVSTILKFGQLFFSFSDAEHFCLTSWANPLSGWLPVFHGNGFCAFHFFLGSAFHTVGIHVAPPIEYDQYITLYLIMIGMVFPKSRIQIILLTKRRECGMAFGLEKSEIEAVFKETIEKGRKRYLGGGTIEGNQAELISFAVSEAIFQG
jgi:hypothetical protein